MSRMAVNEVGTSNSVIRLVGDTDTVMGPHGSVTDFPEYYLVRAFTNVVLPTFDEPITATISGGSYSPLTICGNLAAPYSI